jgi:hypothetical protein
MAILTVSVSGARNLMRQALIQADGLYGRNAVFDERVGEWRANESLLETSSGLQQMLEGMHELLH